MHLGSFSARPRQVLVAALAVATVLAIWLRTYGITSQIVIDDEWHAIHKLLSASYGEIFRTFGWADHSIPLTLFYKALAETVGLTEGRLRALQVVFGVGLIPLSAWLAWRATSDAPATLLYAFLVAGAPFLVLWSRFARPYSITLVLTVISLSAIWRWRTTRTRRLATLGVVCAALSAWLHPISAMYPLLACLFVFVEDILTPVGITPRPAWRSLTLGVAMVGAIATLLAAPLIHDRQSLLGKAGGDQPDFATFERMFAIIWGGLPTPVAGLACVLAIWGLFVFARRDRLLAAYLVVLGMVPAALLTLSGGTWLQFGWTFLRYQLPLQLIVLFFGSAGAISLVRIVTRHRRESAAWLASIGLSTAYLAATPAIAQVATLGPWYGHPDHHWDYRHRWIEGKREHHQYDPPPFYRKLGEMPRGSAPIIEAPYIWEGPYNPFAYYATYHHQDETMGMIHDLCLGGERVGEPPHDRRFRFRKFVYLDDPGSVRQSGARYLLLNLDLVRRTGAPYESKRCLEAVSQLYGPPTAIDSRLAVFSLAR